MKIAVITALAAMALAGCVSTVGVNGFAEKAAAQCATVPMDHHEACLLSARFAMPQTFSAVGDQHYRYGRFSANDFPSGVLGNETRSLSN